MNFPARIAGALALVLFHLGCALWTAPLAAQVPADYAVPLAASARRVPPGIRLTWPADANATGYFILRKSVAANAWENVTPLPASATEWLDSAAALGSQYEYKLVKNTAALTAFGLVCAGLDAPAVEDRGTVLLLVDESHAEALAGELAQLNEDLIGDGWKVIRHDVRRETPVRSIKSLIVADYRADSAKVQAVFLLGHVPVPYAGDFAPDGHADHTGAWPADSYYAGIDGLWTDDTVDDSTAARPQNRNMPGDGKFDQTALPSESQLQIGRVDLSGMPAFVAPEVELLRQYLHRDHAFRHGALAVGRRGLIQDGFGLSVGEPFAAAGWRNFAALLGADQTFALPWFPTLTTESYLWAYGCGNGTYQGIEGLGDTSTFASNGSRAVFNMLFGSYLGDWDATDSILRAPLASAGLGLASVWGNRPAWYFHHMGQGYPIGYCAKVTTNDGSLYEGEVWTHRVHIALMGDPTLRLHPVAPPTGVHVARRPAGGANLNWVVPAGSVEGYHVYRSAGPDGPYVRVNAGLVAGTAFSDTHPGVGASYMVRAVRLEETSSGSYFNLSQGAFADTDLPTVSLSVAVRLASEIGSTAGEVLFSRTGAIVAPLKVAYSLAGTAINGVDYGTLSGELTIPAGKRSALLLIEPKAVDGFQPSRSVRVVLVANAGYTKRPPTTAEVVIVDDRYVFHPYTDRYAGLVLAASPGGARGFISATLGAAGSVSVLAKVGEKVVRVVGAFDRTGELTAAIPGEPDIQIRLRLDIENGTSAITGELMKSGQLVATFAAKRDSPPSSVSKAAGFYTVGLLPDAAQPDPSVPEGAGWAIARVNRYGRGSLVGRLADDTPISTGIVLSMEGRWVCYSQPDGPMGSILGEVTFDDTAENSDGAGVLDWSKAARPSAAFYPAGFSTRLSLVACRFVPSSERQPVLPFANAAGNARWVARGGGLPLPLQILLTIGRRGVARVLGPSAESLQIGLGSGAGIFAGGFIRPDVNRPASFRGVVLQKAGRAVGYFPGVRKTGFVGIEQSSTIPGAEGGGLNGDWTRPVLEITAPANGARISEAKDSGGFGFPPPALLVQGAARSDSTIAAVQYQRLHRGTVSDLSTASGTNNWIVALYLTAADAGENTVFVKTIDMNGNESPLSYRTFTYVVLRDLLVGVSGMGEVTGGFLGKTSRELGKSYRIGATPSPGYRFTGWSGAVSSSSRIIEFTMAEGFSLQAHFVPVN